jgi:hypothetical protein
MKQLQVGRDPTSVPTYSIELTDAGYSARIAAGVDTSVAVPSAALFALVTSDESIYVSAAAVTLPTLAAGFGAANVMLNPPMITLSGETALHVICRSDADVTVVFYR